MWVGESENEMVYASLATERIGIKNIRSDLFTWTLSSSTKNYKHESQQLENHKFIQNLIRMIFF